MDSSALVLGLRVALALACVLGLLWFLGRRAAGTGAVKRSRQAAMSVVAKQSLGGRAGIALVEVSGRRLLLGVTEHGVNLLTEVDVPLPEAADVRERVELDPAVLEAAVLEADTAPDVVPDNPVTGAVPARPTHPSTPAARMPAVPTPRSPLEGSVLSATTWRQAMVAVQERTIRR
ncbi:MULTISPECIES: flagellar biosynthetic protein FliO [unclassified Actinotalea]|uniref:flagellar biosynthetic protein FliO n=1 Tax=unclassified Actinotalea TaxID=2638618 RepID=UPI0015F4EDD3|nr:MULTISPECIES: flagellar biosynthetic protein FliO [unclassified Actinotalea]